MPLHTAKNNDAAKGSHLQSEERDLQLRLVQEIQIMKIQPVDQKQVDVLHVSKASDQHGLFVSYPEI